MPPSVFYSKKPYRAFKNQLWSFLNEILRGLKIERVKIKANTEQRIIVNCSQNLTTNLNKCKHSAKQLFLKTKNIMKYLVLIIGFWVLGCTEQPQNAFKQKETEPIKTDLTIKKSDKYRIIHVFVALCDNEHQGIVKVPPKIGNGKDPENNLYWGCDLGTKTFLKKHKNWKLVQTIQKQRDKVLERCIFKHKESNVYIVADAYDGEYIKKCTSDFLHSCSGNFTDFFVSDKDTIACGGSSDLLGYIGHDGLMEFKLKEKFVQKDSLKRETIILACTSKTYFEPYLRQTGATPLIWTTGLMAPEAYTLVAAIEAWIQKKDNSAIREAAAQAYNKYQNCGIRASRNLLVNE